MGGMDEWDDLIDDGENEDADLDALIALAELRLSSLRCAKAMRGMARAFQEAGEAVRQLVDTAVLSQSEIDDSPR